LVASNSNHASESVWEYPCPPRLEVVQHHVQVIFNNIVIADSRRPLRLVELGHPPIYFIPPEDVRMEYLHPTTLRTVCPHNGLAWHYSVRVGNRCVEDAAWTFLHPLPPYSSLAEYIAFCPAHMQACLVDGELASSPPMQIHPGWVTAGVKGPFAGDVITGC